MKFAPQRRRAWRLIGTVVSVIAFGASLTACAGESGESGAAEKYHIGVFLPANSNAYLQVMETTAKEAAAELGVDVTVVTSDWDSQSQNAAFELAKQRQTYDAWVVTSISPAEQCDTILDAAESGIPVIITVTAICGDDGYTDGTVAFVGEQNRAGYDKWFEYIAASAPPGEVAVLTGPPLDFVTETTTAAANAALPTSEGLKLATVQNTDYLTETAYQAAQTFLQSNSDLVAIASNYSGMTRGVVEAVEQSGRDVLVYDSNGDSWTKEQIESGKILGALPGMPATDLQLSMQAIVDHLNGETVETVINPLDQLQFSGAPIITPENVSQWEPEY